MLLSDSPIMKDTFENFVTKFGRITSSSSSSELDRKWAEVLKDHYALIMEERRLYGTKISSAKGRMMSKSRSSERARSREGSRVASKRSFSASIRSTTTGESIKY